jgi:large subunit ribosomal protein L29
MKTNEKEQKRALGVAELESELHQAQEKLFKAQFKHQVTPLANPLELRSQRRHVARLKTWIAEKKAAAQEKK